MAKDKKKEPEQTPETQEQKAEASQPEEAEKGMPSGGDRAAKAAKRV